MSSTTAGEHPYPSEREADIVLRDGSTVHVRPAPAPAPVPSVLT
jgi:hypothetical protein